MGHNTFGFEYSVTTFGESHGEAIGVVIDGSEAGFPIDMQELQHDLDRRRPGANKLGTTRREQDKVHILSGVFEGKTTGTPICMVIENTNQNSSAYDKLRDLYRPGHADYTYQAKYGIRDHRGGGRSSARESAARVAGGALARQLLKKKGITIQAGCVQIGTIRTDRRNWEEASANPLSCPDKEKAFAMEQLIEQARAKGDSVGGVIECVIRGLPAGVGDPEFDKLEAKLGQAMLSINASKGVEFGEGFYSAELWGSQNNDAMDKDGFVTNHAGGILGGISTGSDILLRVAFKPTPSIRKEQHTITTRGEETTLTIEGRHDPCVCPRAVVVVEAMAAITTLDAYYSQFGRNG